MRELLAPLELEPHVLPGNHDLRGPLREAFGLPGEGEEHGLLRGRPRAAAAGLPRLDRARHRRRGARRGADRVARRGRSARSARSRPCWRCTTRRWSPGCRASTRSGWRRSRGRRWRGAGAPSAGGPGDRRPRAPADRRRAGRARRPLGAQHLPAGGAEFDPAPIGMRPDPPGFAIHALRDGALTSHVQTFRAAIDLHGGSLSAQARQASAAARAARPPPRVGVAVGGEDVLDRQVEDRRQARAQGVEARAVEPGLRAEGQALPLGAVAEQDVAGEERRPGGVPEDDLVARQRPDRDQPAGQLLADPEGAVDGARSAICLAVTLEGPERRVGMALTDLRRRSARGSGASPARRARRSPRRLRQLLPLVADQQRVDQDQALPARRSRSRGRPAPTPRGGRSRCAGPGAAPRRARLPLSSGGSRRRLRPGPSASAAAPWTTVILALPASAPRTSDSAVGAEPGVHHQPLDPPFGRPPRRRPAARWRRGCRRAPLPAPSVTRRDSRSASAFSTAAATVSCSLPGRGRDQVRLAAPRTASPSAP